MQWLEFPDRQLVELCLEGSEDAWAEFFRRFHRLVAGVVAKTLPIRFRTNDAIKDLVQDTWKRVLSNDFHALRSLEWRHDKALRGLLSIAASTAAKDYIRGLKSQKRDIDKEDQLDPIVKDVAAKENLERQVNHKILLEQLARCLGEQIRDETNRTRDIAIFLLYYSHRVTASDLDRVYKLGVRAVENTAARLARIAREHCL